eukprot:1107119-Pyramimonas_sp.AAC.1
MWRLQGQEAADGRRRPARVAAAADEAGHPSHTAQLRGVGHAHEGDHLRRRPEDREDDAGGVQDSHGEREGDEGAGEAEEGRGEAGTGVGIRN